MNTTMISNQKKSARRFALSGFLSNISIAWKMGLMALVLFLGTLGVAVAAYNGLQSLRYHLSNIYDFMLIPILALSEADTALADTQFHLENLDEVTGSELAESVEHIQANTKLAVETIERYDTEWVTTSSPEFSQALQNAGKIELQQQEVASLESFHVTFEAYQVAVTKYLATVQAGHPDAILAEEVDENIAVSRAELNGLINVNNEFADFSNAEAQAAFRQALMTGGIVLGIGLALGLVMSYLIVVSITSRLSELTRSAATMQAGDLEQTVSVTGRDEVGLLGKTFNTMAEQLKRLFDTLEQRVADRTRDLATVAKISTATATIRDPFEMLANMVHLTQRGFNLYHAHVFTYNKETEALQIVACGYKEGDEHEGTHGTTSIQMTQEQSLVARAARTRQPVIVNNVRSDPGWLPNPLLPDTHAELAVPMIAGDELLGVLDVQADHIDAFTEESANIQMTLASQVATALQNAQAYSRTQKQAELESLVNVIGQKIQRTTSVEETLQTAIRELGMVIGAGRVRASLKPAPSAVATEPRASYGAIVAGEEENLHTESMSAD